MKKSELLSLMEGGAVFMLKGDVHRYYNYDPATEPSNHGAIYRSYQPDMIDRVHEVNVGSVTATGFKCYTSVLHKGYNVFLLFSKIIIPSSFKFDIERNDLYMNKSYATKYETKRRLIEIALIGMEETETFSFGIPGVMSGLYIEKIWNMTGSEWRQYVKWVSDLKKSKAKVRADSPFIKKQPNKQ